MSSGSHHPKRCKNGKLNGKQMQKPMKWQTFCNYCNHATTIAATAAAVCDYSCIHKVYNSYTYMFMK